MNENGIPSSNADDRSNHPRLAGKPMKNPLRLRRRHNASSGRKNLEAARCSFGFLPKAAVHCFDGRKAIESSVT